MTKWFVQVNTRDRGFGIYNILVKNNRITSEWNEKGSGCSFCWMSGC